MRKPEFLLFPGLYLISWVPFPVPHLHLHLPMTCQRWTCECPSQEWLQKKSPRTVHPSHIISIKGQPEVWLIPITVNEELKNPLILVQQHALLMMIGIMTILFPGETLAFWWEGGVGRCDCRALPVLCCRVSRDSGWAGTGPWDHAKPTLQPGQSLLWQEHWDGQCWTTPAKARDPALGGIARYWKHCRKSLLSAFSSRGCRGRLC